MAQDEGRFGRISRPKRCWAPPGIRPSVPSQVVRESMYVFAAFAPSLGRLVSLVLPTANTATMNLFLEHLSQTLADYFIVMQGGLCWVASLPRADHPKQHSLDPAARLQPRSQPGFAFVGRTAREIFSQPLLLLA